MKLTILFITLCFLQVSAASYAQKINLSGSDMSLVKALESIHKQSGYALFYNNTLVKQAGNTSINLKDTSLEDAMNEVLKDKPFTYTIIDKTIVIKEKEPTILDKLKKVFTPPTDVIGRVTNEQGQPLNGATITIKRTQSSTLSDANGNFTVRGVSPTDTLIISYLGYKRAFIGVCDQTSLKVVLQVATNQLDQVVIQAYGETSQRLATGNIGTVTAAQIAKQPVMNVLEALQGQIPGVVVTNTSGYASGTVKVEIRGRNTINPNFSSDPLYIIDGVPLTILDLKNTESYAGGSIGVIQSGIYSPANGQSPFFSVNPADIESIEVLKDADATAIYGSRGANGVILVTTKKGKAGKTKLDLNLNTGYSKITNYYPLLNSQQYVAMRKEALTNDGVPININTAPDLLTWDTSRYTNWQKYLWGNLGKQTDAEATLSGGDAQTTFRIGMGYRYATEILTANGANQRGSLSFNLNHKSLDQRFNVTLSGTYTIASSDMILAPGNIVSLVPIAPSIYDKNGNLNFSGWQPLDGIFPFGVLLQPYTTKTNFLNSNMVLNYSLFKGLDLRTNLGYSNIQTNQTSLTPIASQDPINNPTGTSEFGSTFINNLIIEPQLEYNRFIGKGKLDVLAGASYQQNSTSSFNLIGNGYTNDALLSSINNAPIPAANNGAGKYDYAAVFGRVNYNLKDKYILDLNGRRDGSSKFGPGHRFGNFGSIGGAWIFSEENWLKDKLPLLSYGKLRASYGTTGGDQIGSYAYLSLWSYAQALYNNRLPLNPLGHTDSLLHWQVNKKTEVAMDLGFLKDRIVLNAVWYRNICDDQLVQFPTPILTGFNSVTSNSPAKVENWGWEFSLNAKIIDNTDFKWLTRFNIGINRNKLLAYPNFSQSPYAGFLTIGQSLNIVKVLHFTGVDPQTGLYTFEDKNHDGQITIDQSGKTIDDRGTIDLSPKYDGGFTNNFSYKNWGLSLFFYFKKQMGANELSALHSPGDQSNQPLSVLNRWQKPGDITTTAKFTTMPYDISFQNFSQSDAVYSNASFIRLRNLSLSYTLPDKSLKKMGISNCRIYIEGENLFTITPYPGLDPETQGFGGIPTAKYLTIGISSNF